MHPPHIHPHRLQGPSERQFPVMDPREALGQEARRSKRIGNQFLFLCLERFELRVLCLCLGVRSSVVLWAESHPSLGISTFGSRRPSWLGGGGRFVTGGLWLGLGGG